MGEMVKFIKSLIKSSFFKFGCVGVLGILVNNTIFFIFVDLIKLPLDRVFLLHIPLSDIWLTIIATIAFLVVATQNYAINHVWTFKKVTAGDRHSFYGWFKYLLSSLGGLGSSLIVLNILLAFFNFPVKVIALLCASGTGVIFNFIGSKFFVFRKKKSVEQEEEPGKVISNP